MHIIAHDTLTLKKMDDIKRTFVNEKMDYLNVTVTNKLRSPDKYFEKIKGTTIALSAPNTTSDLVAHNAAVFQREQREKQMKNLINKQHALKSTRPAKRQTAISETLVHKDSGNYRISHLMYLFERRAEDWVRHLDWDQTPDGLFGLIPKFQRGLVWTLKQKQDLILSMLRDVPIGVFYINELRSDFYKDTKRLYDLDSILYDGQQRFMAIKGFLEGEFPLTIAGEDFYAGDVHPKDISKIKNTVVPIYTTYISELDELIEYYVFINTGGTLHTKEDIEKARQYQSNRTTH